MQRGHEKRTRQRSAKENASERRSNEATTRYNAHDILSTRIKFHAPHTYQDRAGHVQRITRCDEKLRILHPLSVPTNHGETYDLAPSIRKRTQREPDETSRPAIRTVALSPLQRTQRTERTNTITNTNGCKESATSLPLTQRSEPYAEELIRLNGRTYEVNEVNERTRQRTRMTRRNERTCHHEPNVAIPSRAKKYDRTYINGPQRPRTSERMNNEATTTRRTDDAKTTITTNKLHDTTERGSKRVSGSSTI